MRGRRAVVGVDLGTSGVKVLVVGLDDAVPDDRVLGRVLGRGRAEYPVLVPSVGRAESNPGDWWRSTCRAVRQALAQALDAEIVAIAVAGQMHGLVLTAPPPPLHPPFHSPPQRHGRRRYPPHPRRPQTETQTDGRPCGRQSCGSTSGPPPRPTAT